MLKYSAIVLLFACLLVKPTFSKSVDSNSLEEDNSVHHIQLLRDVLSKFADISEITLRTGKKLLQNVIKDVSHTALDKPKELRSKLSELQQFVDKLENLNYNEDVAKFEAVAELSDLLERYNGTAPVAEGAPERQWTNVDATFKTSLQQNGLEEAAQEFVGHFVTFVKWFNTAAEDYWRNLSPKEKIENTKFDVWFQQFKNEREPEKQIVKFEEFFVIFD